MAKLFYARFLFLALAMFLVVDKVVVLHGVAAAECEVVLAPSGCDIATCRQQCLQQKNGRGVCVPNTDRTDFQCQCFFDCPPASA